MKKLIMKTKQYWVQRPIYKTWESMPDKLLFLFFVCSSLPAFYYAYVLSQLWTPYLDAVNEVGFNYLGIFLSLIMLALTLVVWFFGAIAKRTNDLLYERWFK